MKKTISLTAIASLLLISCNSGPSTIAYGSSQITYPSSWETFTNDGTSGINIKDDVSCWIDTTGDVTTPMEGEYDTTATDGDVTIYSYEGEDPSFVSFTAGEETVYARVSIESPSTCVGYVMELAELN